MIWRSLQKHTLDPHQNMKVNVPTGCLTERELVWLSQSWELKPAPQHTIPASSPQITFPPSAMPPPPSMHELSDLHLCKELCTFRRVQTLLVYCSHAFTWLSGVLPPAIHFTNAWNDKGTELILCLWNFALSVKKGKNWVLLLKSCLIV